MTEITLNQFADGPWREFSIYTIENRAIPSMVDGFKPSQRFIMYSAFKNAHNRWLKVSSLAAIAEYGYHHGDAAAQEAASLMAADWCNNQPCLLGDGNFGDRLVKEAASPRYVFAQVHPLMEKIFKDNDLCPAHDDPEHIPPKFYLPIIPMVLVNGISGIATGYATDIPPYALADVKNLCLKYIQGKDIDTVEMSPTLYGFKGKIERNAKGGYDQVGIVELKGKTTAIISEVPFKYDRVKYIEVLEELKEKGTILRYDEDCGEQGFRFKVDLKRGFDTKSNEDLIKLFKLRSSFPVNLTVLDADKKLRKFDSPQALIKEFCDFRLPYYAQRIAKRLAETEWKLRVAVAKIKFIRSVLDNTLVFKGKSKSDLTSELSVSFETELIPSLLGMDFYSLTTDEITKQIGVAKELDLQRKFWKDATPADQFQSDLKQI
ncbi:DNA gyrase subunit A [compost metagenome]